VRKQRRKFSWLVVHDPSQMYLGPFDMLTLNLTARAGYWPEGIIFQHKRTQKRLIFQDGRLQTCASSEEVSHDRQN